MKKVSFLLFIGFMIIGTSYSQNINKLLTKEEHKRLEENDTIHKYLGETNSDEGFIGTVLVKKINNKIEFTEIGTWVRNNSEYGDDAVMVWDSVGRLVEYKEFNENHSVGFDCQYWYETINGKYYRLENMKIYDEFGNLSKRGFRYWVVKKDDFGFFQTSRKRRFGEWEFYDFQGNLIKKKDYGEIK